MEINSPKSSGLIVTPKVCDIGTRRVSAILKEDQKKRRMEEAS